MPMDYKSLGSRIKEVRKRKGLTQERLAELADLSTTHTSNIENGNAVSSVKTLVNIANALACTADDLLCDSLTYSRDVYKLKALEILDGCTIEEVRILTETMTNTLNTFRKHYKPH